MFHYINICRLVRCIGTFSKVSFKRVITNLDRPCAMPAHEMRLERRLIAETIGLNLVISLLKRTFEKVPILLNNRGIFREWYIDMGDHITTYFFRIT